MPIRVSRSIVLDPILPDAPAIAPQLVPMRTSPEKVAPVLREIGESFLNFQVVAKRESEQRAELAGTPDVVAAVPYFESDIFDVAGLLKLGRTIWGEA